MTTTGNMFKLDDIPFPFRFVPPSLPLAPLALGIRNAMGVTVGVRGLTAIVCISGGLGFAVGCFYEPLKTIAGKANKLKRGTALLIACGLVGTGVLLAVPTKRAVQAADHLKALKNAFEGILGIGAALASIWFKIGAFLGLEEEGEQGEDDENNEEDDGDEEDEYDEDEGDEEDEAHSPRAPSLMIRERLVKDHEHSAKAMKMGYHFYTPHDQQPVVKQPPQDMGATGDLCFCPGHDDLWIKADHHWRKSLGIYDGRHRETHGPSGELRIQHEAGKFRWTTHAAYLKRNQREKNKEQKRKRDDDGEDGKEGKRRAKDKGKSIAAPSAPSSPAPTPSAASSPLTELSPEPELANAQWSMQQLEQHAVHMGNDFLVELARQWRELHGDLGTSAHQGNAILEAAMRYHKKIERKPRRPNSDFVGSNVVQPSLNLVMADILRLGPGEEIIVVNVETGTSYLAPTSEVLESLMVHANRLQGITPIPWLAAFEIPQTEDGMGRCKFQRPVDWKRSKGDNSLRGATIICPGGVVSG
ncbi:hypothetical protein CALVIDRAFT_568610 [Calocera viscosa TUFC12733]|uniref:Uncharacterized protein n=1 Tax=Calocera viscosa (strain TUFC12733) TaxID=1330018 RepID=A0A167GUU6_CALVF|nr:hypothetical protein CALVIDRAFT_568610 [Calocera viscosa TUFC12733]